MRYRDSRAARERERAKHRRMRIARQAFKRRHRRERLSHWQKKIRLFFLWITGRKPLDEHEAEKRRIRRRIREKRKAEKAKRWRQFFNNTFQSVNKSTNAIDRPVRDRLITETDEKVIRGEVISARERERLEKERLRRIRKKNLARFRLEKKAERRRKLLAFTQRLFGFGNPTPEEITAKKLKKKIRAKRALERQERLKRFLRNPMTIFNNPSPEKIEAKRYRKNLRRLRRIQSRESFIRFFNSGKQLLTLPDLRNKFLNAVFESISWYLLSFFLIYFIYQAVTVLIASSFDIPVIWNFCRLLWPLPDWSPFWTRQALIVIFGAGPILAIIIAFLSLGLFYYFKKNSPLSFNVLWVWMIVHGINMFFGSYIAGVATRTEFIYASEWIFLNNQINTTELALSLISIAVLILSGWLVTRLFLESAGSVTLISPEFRLHFIIGRVVIPWITGLIAVIIYNTPKYFFPLILKSLTPFLIVLTVLLSINANRYRDLHLTGSFRQSKFNRKNIFIVILIIVLYRIVFNVGVTFG